MQEGLAPGNQQPLGQMSREDIIAVVERDPACQNYSHALLYFKGFLGIQVCGGVKLLRLGGGLKGKAWR